MALRKLKEERIRKERSIEFQRRVTEEINKRRKGQYRQQEVIRVHSAHTSRKIITDNISSHRKQYNYRAGINKTVKKSSRKLSEGQRRNCYGESDSENSIENGGKKNNLANIDPDIIGIGIKNYEKTMNGKQADGIWKGKISPIVYCQHMEHLLSNSEPGIDIEEATDMEATTEDEDSLVTEYPVYDSDTSDDEGEEEIEITYTEADYNDPERSNRIYEKYLSEDKSKIQRPNSTNLTTP